MLKGVRVPEGFEPIFEKAQEFVQRHFDDRVDDPSQGTIEIHGQRYILVRAAAMSVEFFELISNLYRDRGEREAASVARSLLFDIAHSIGRSDARVFHQLMGVTDPVEKLSAGPLHFARSGWAFVDILPESSPTPDDNYFLAYNHPYSFEADSWMRAGKTPDFPVCIMNAGYSSGWCEESFGLPLVAAELTCKARGDEHCRFVMATPERIEGRIRDYAEGEPDLAKSMGGYEIPGFFSRKRMEEELRASEEKYHYLFEGLNDAAFLVDIEMGLILETNLQGEVLLGKDRSLIVGMHQAELHPVADAEKYGRQFAEHVLAGGTPGDEAEVVRSDGTIVPVIISATVMNIRGRRCMLGIFRDETEAKRSQQAITAVNETFLRLGPDVAANIHAITETCGKLLGATCALYNRLEGGMLCALGRWQTPPDYVPEDRPEGHICYDVIREGGAKARVIADLPGSKYFETDPSVARYGLKTYIGCPVLRSGEPVGALCAVFTEDLDIGPGDMEFMEILARALGREEERQLAEEEARGAELRYRAVFANTLVGVAVLDPETGTLLECNETVCNMLGFTPDELRGINFEDAHLEEDLPRVREFLGRLAKGGDIVTAEKVPFKKKDGGIFHFDISGSTFTQGGKTYLAGLFCPSAGGE